MSGLDMIIHQPARLKIMSVLMGLEIQEQVDFSCLKKMLGFTDGNLGAHLIKLEEAEYLYIEKTFVDRKPRSFISITDKGRRAFEDYVAVLQGIIKGA
ncbi:MAG: transcriptional regulator [Planctomycetes bacterium]|nr:transcriptional regulator [Planctomycetota bacterium]